ncbi:hypothetical protein F4604DRAFT_1579229, partial [Suillus subluteus]
VGYLPPVISGRSEPPLSSVVKSEKGEGVYVVAAPREWITAGYLGKGMVHAWLSGKALADMVLGCEVEGRLGELFLDIMKVAARRGGRGQRWRIYWIPRPWMVSVYV